ncbi:hypothetical protein HK14_12195 [Acetobacter cibinongensis]|uniref:Uncharacterized protein n=1 Tax=Acetobacter cibinongensis TaxID=146475 RepID=A0A1Z5YY44_9PROT|nr:hypothetical protein HK14_12195 [Acetobacter cibinongensis]
MLAFQKTLYIEAKIHLKKLLKIYIFIRAFLIGLASRRGLSEHVKFYNQAKLKEIVTQIDAAYKSRLPLWQAMG